MDVKIEQSWKQVLQREFDEPYFAELVRFLHGEKAAGKIIYCLLYTSPSPRDS